MPDSNNEIECGTHGKAYTAFVCTHLLEDPKQEWFCDYPSGETPWPDAWCDACEREFQKYGEWNEKNEQAVDIKLLCHFCYEEFQGSSVAPLMALRAGAWQPFVSDAVSALRAKQDELNERFDLSKHERFDYDLDKGEILFSNAGKPAVTARIQVVGSISTVSDTWLWSWANHWLGVDTAKLMLPIRSFGEKERFACLTVPRWPAGQADGWEMTAVAAKILDASGAYRAPGETGFTFMLLTDLVRAE